jgi:hypothetical protein
MSVFDSISTAMFDQILMSLNRVAHRAGDNTYSQSAMIQSDESMIGEINRLAEELLPSNEPPELTQY